MLILLDSGRLDGRRAHVCWNRIQRSIGWELRATLDLARLSKAPWRDAWYRCGCRVWTKSSDFAWSVMVLRRLQKPTVQNADLSEGVLRNHDLGMSLVKQRLSQEESRKHCNDDKLCPGRDSRSLERTIQSGLNLGVPSKLESSVSYA